MNLDTTTWFFIIGGVVGALLILVPAFKIVWQFERGLVFRFGKFRGERTAGLNFIVPYIDRMINPIRNILYLIARLLGDVNAVQKGRVKRRIGRRIAGKVTGKALWRLFK